MTQLERQRKYEYPARFTPKGLVDALDATDAFPGACVNLQNLIFDQSNPELVIAKPGTTTIVDFTAGVNYLSLDGAGFDYANTPNAAANRITGDLEIIAYIAADNYAPAGATDIISKRGNLIDIAYAFSIVGGNLNLTWSTTGSFINGQSRTSTATIPAAAGQAIWVRVTLDVNDGSGNNVVTFYTSQNPYGTALANIAWTMLGSAITTAGTTSIFGSVADLEAGARTAGGAALFAGKIFKAYLYNGLVANSGTLAASMVANDTTVGSPSWVSALTGETWTNQGTATIAGTAFVGAGVISVQTTIGNVTYGMISTTRNAGKDEPFAYDNSTGAFLNITGVTNANSPTTQATSGPWTPPTMASVGVYLIVTHPGFATGANKFGYFDLTNPAAPVWNAGDTATNALPSVPIWVANFNNRAYFGCTNTTPYTDVISLTRTSATQALTIGDTASTTAGCGLPVQTTSSGIVQALIVFKNFQVWQITGDPANTPANLALNYISLNVGCQSPRSIVSTPAGIYFVSISGLMMVNQFGALIFVLNSAKDDNPDIQAPMNNAVVPSRIAGGYSSTVYRVCMETIINGADVTNDYWFDEHRRRFNGPHTFTYDCVSQYGNFFILCSNANPAKLFKSEAMPSVNSSYQDAGATMTCTLQSSTFPKTGHMTVKQVIESTQELGASNANNTFQLTALDEQGTTLDNCNITIAAPGTLWGSGVWGAFSWASGFSRPRTYTVPWTKPLVFKKLALLTTAPANGALAIGTGFSRYKEAGYSNTPTS